MTSDFMQMGTLQGWQCPICKRILAPFVQECPCKGQGPETWTTTTGTGTIKKHIPTITIDEDDLDEDIGEL